MSLRLSLIVLSLPFLLTACPDQPPAKAKTKNTASAPKTEASAAKAVTPTNLLKASDGRSELTLPPHWRALGDVDSLNSDARLQLGSEQTSAAIAVFTDLKVDFDEMTLEKRNEQYMVQLSANMKRAKRKLGPRQLTVNGMPAIQYRVEFVNPDNVNMVAVLTSIEGEQCFYQMLYVSLQSELAQEQPSLDAALNSFRQVSKPLPPGSPAPAKPVVVAPSAAAPRTTLPAPVETATPTDTPSGGVQPIPVYKR